MSARVVDQNVFRDVIGRFASGVTVITTRVGDADYGTTASAVSSLSMDPPMLLICMNRTSETGQAIHESGHFTVNILGEDQGEIAERFATKGADKFGGVEIERGLDDLPHVANALGHLDCLVAETATGGTHTVFLSLVEHASATEGSPLTYYRGRFGRFEDTAQEAVYQQLRGMVMAREVAVGAPLDIDELAASLELERPRLQYALMKLTTDGLVERDPDKGWIVRPIDAAMARHAIHARSVIEVAVVEELAGRIDEAQVAELRGYANAAITSVEREPPDYAQLRDAGRRFHRTLIGLTGNDTLVDMYQRLRIDSIWGRLLKGRHLNPDYLAVIPEALVAGDATAAKEAIRAHAQHATAVVEEMIAKAGGTI
jgi:DNA-binding GntR family transcriptional regulator/flavin reductase (DIM6/NTAB) family NADH-FMN oxidoreductase RutF